MRKHDPKSIKPEKIADALMTEINKPEDEIDWEYVELCENVLSDLTEYKKPSKHEVDIRVKQILAKDGKTYTVPINRKPRLAFAALVASVILLFSCITVFATTPKGITYIDNGEKTVYRTLNDLLEAENLDFFYPQEIAYDARITEVRRNGANQTVFVFDDPRLSFEVYHDNSDDPSQNNSGAIDFLSLLSSTECSYLYFSINNDEYALSCDSRELLDEMMDSFNFER